MTEPLTLYKLIVLYMLTKVNFPLTSGQITGFILEQGYTTYFTLQQALSELSDSDLVHTESLKNTTQYTITEEGKKTLTFFQNKISQAIRSDIDSYLKAHKLELRNEVSVLADYYKTEAGEYTVHCVVKEKEADLVDLTLTVPLKEQAVSICNHWNDRCQEVYAYLMKTLMHP